MLLVSYDVIVALVLCDVVVALFCTTLLLLLLLLRCRLITSIRNNKSGVSILIEFPWWSAVNNNKNSLAVK